MRADLTVTGLPSLAPNLLQRDVLLLFILLLPLGGKFTSIDPTPSGGKTTPLTSHSPDLALALARSLAAL